MYCDMLEYISVTDSTNTNNILPGKTHCFTDKRVISGLITRCLCVLQNITLTNVIVGSVVGE